MSGARKHARGQRRLDRDAPFYAHVANGRTRRSKSKREDAGEGRGKRKTYPKPTRGA